MPGLLRLGTGDEIRDPSAQDVEEGVRALRGTDSSVVLDCGDGRFMQVASAIDYRGRDEGFVALEYCDGAPDSHFQCLQGLDLDPVIRAFRSFHAGQNDFREMFRWKRLKL